MALLGGGIGVLFFFVLISNACNGLATDGMLYVQDIIIAMPLFVVGAYYGRGLVKLELEDYTGAVQDFNKALEITPDHGMAVYARGAAKASLGDVTGALNDFYKAKELGVEESQEYIDAIQGQ